MNQESKIDRIMDAAGINYLELKETFAEVTSKNVSPEVPPDMLEKWKSDKDFLLNECKKYRACAIAIGKLFCRQKAEKNRRYKKRCIISECTMSQFKMWKRLGMSDADAFRQIINFEHPNLKPGTASHIAAMNRLRMWKSRHKEEL